MMDRKTMLSKMFVLFHLIYRIKAVPVKTPASYFLGVDKLILKLTEAKDPE